MPICRAWTQSSLPSSERSRNGRQSTGRSPMGETAISRGLRRTAAVPLLSRRLFLIDRLVEMHPRTEGRIPGVVSSLSVVQLRLGRRFALTPGAQMLMATGSLGLVGARTE